MPERGLVLVRFLSAAIIRLSLCGVLLGAARPLVEAARASAADEPGAEAAARKKLQQQLASRKSGERLEALAALRNYPSADMAKQVVSRGLKDREEEVRRAAESTLLAVKDNPEVCEYLVDLLNKEGRPKAGLEPLYPVFRVLLASNSPNAREGLFSYLDKNAATLPDAAVVMMSDFAEELGKRALPAEFAQLERMAKSKTCEREFGLRRTVVRAATRYAIKEAVGLLFGMLEKEKGELRGDIVEYLGQVTGEQHGVNTVAWLRWWQEHEKTFECPRRPAPALVRKVVEGKASGSYYGIPLYAKRMVFVLDTSNSMRGERIVAAKRDLTNTVMGLDEDCYFGLITFNSGVYVWQKTLVQANDKSKRAADYWIMGQELAVRTASYDALEAAMQFDAEAIYFLTDGAPSGGRIDDPAEIVRAISLLNRVRRESIYSIGVGLRRAGNKHEAFLKSLAAANYGIYRRVDE
jgi:hypothetical protein